ncbi:MAG TPA: sigma-70 family RNA polymerase sigma factor [Candidatus Acidoferrales bacterium]|nr:sigma-70 family RNA polymerase sigma factor [Candidatus Acidoferrales bacterium]
MQPGTEPEEQNAAGLTDAIRRAREGDSDAWADVYRQFAPAVFRFCRRAMPSREDAEDATSEVFLKVRGKLDQYDASRPFNAWLYRVAANQCWDLLRRRRVRQDLETGDIETMPLEHPDPGQLERLLAERSAAHVRKGLEQLPSRTRMALTLRYYAEMSYDEIAETLGVRRAFVGVLLLRARHQLRRVLEEAVAGQKKSAVGGKA